MGCGVLPAAGGRAGGAGFHRNTKCEHHIRTFNNFAKVTSEMLAVWAKLLRRCRARKLLV